MHPPNSIEMFLSRKFHNLGKTVSRRPAAFVLVPLFLMVSDCHTIMSKGRRPAHALPMSHGFSSHFSAGRVWQSCILASVRILVLGKRSGGSEIAAA